MMRLQIAINKINFKKKTNGFCILSKIDLYQVCSCTGNGILSSHLVAGSLESANSSIPAVQRLFKDLVGEKIRIL